jgi:hypothetical protein
LMLRDTGTAVDIESIGVPLFVNNTTKQNLSLNPSGGQVSIGTAPRSSYALTVGGGPVYVYDSAVILGNLTVGQEVVLRSLNVHGTKNFRIDHPLDPANKYLSHAAIESSEVLNMYTGNVVLDANGEAGVEFPEWFGAINADFRYQLTAIGAPGPNLYIAKKMKNNSFRIAGGNPGMDVSWQVTCLRQDAYMKAHPFVVETDKPANKRGIHPEAPVETSVIRKN